MAIWQNEIQPHYPSSNHTHKHAHVHRVLNDSPRFNYTLNTKHCTLWNSIVAVWRASASLTLDVNLTANLWQQTLSENTYSTHTHMHASTHARTNCCDSHRSTQRNCCKSTSVNRMRAVSPSAAVCRYTVSKAGPLPHRAQGLMGVLGGTISGGRMCTGGVRGEHAQFTGGLTTRLTTPVTLAPNEKHN